MPGLASLLVLLLSTSNAPQVKDTAFSLRYNLPVGLSFTYRITTDQFVIRNAGVRLHTAVKMEIAGYDENGHSICRFSLKSDTVTNEDDNWVYRPMGDIYFGGHRLYAEAGHVELLLDATGHLVDNTPSVEDLNRMPETVTQFSRTVDVQENDPELLGASGSYMLQFIVPSLPDSAQYKLHTKYVDTVMFNSRAVHLPTTYGTGAVNEKKQARLLLTDTLLRTSVLDSVRLVGDRYIGFMTLTNERRNALGGYYTSLTEVERDMTSGIVRSVRERCYRRSGDDTRLAYYARAELLSSEPIKRK